MARTFFNKTNVDLNSGFTPSFEVKLFGDWDKSIRILQKLDKTIKEAGIGAQLKVGQSIIKKVKEHLRNQDLPWPDLSPKYSKAKSAAGLDSRTLIAYGTYYHALKVWQKGNQHMVFIGVPKGVYTRELDGTKSKIDVAKIAAMHEFASGRRVPKRALWNPTIKELGGANGVKTAFVKSFVGHLRVRGIPVRDFMGIRL